MRTLCLNVWHNIGHPLFKELVNALLDPKSGLWRRGFQPCPPGVHKSSQKNGESIKGMVSRCPSTSLFKKMTGFFDSIHRHPTPGKGRKQSSHVPRRVDLQRSGPQLPGDSDSHPASFLRPRRGTPGGSHPWKNLCIYTPEI